MPNTHNQVWNYFLKLYMHSVTAVVHNQYIYSPNPSYPYKNSTWTIDVYASIFLNNIWSSHDDDLSPLTSKPN